jgi:hypothetical protein
MVKQNIAAVKLLTDPDGGVTGVIAQDDLIRIAFSSTPLDQIGNLFENIFKACADAGL